MDKSRFYVSYGQISNIIGDEPWMKSEVHCLCNLSSHRILMLTMGSKRKLITNKGEFCGAGNNIEQIEIDDMVTVSNHGNLFPLAIVKKINNLEKTVNIKWDLSLKTDTVELCHLKKYSVNVTNKEKRKETDFLHLQNNEHQTVVKTNDRSKVQSTTTLLSMSNKFFSSANNSKLCAEEALKNLLYMLKIYAQYIKVFWTLATSLLSTISDSLQEDIPKAACNSHQQMNSKQKCLWILRTKFRSISTQKLKLSGLTSVRNTLHVLRQFEFPIIISVHCKICSLQPRCHGVAGPGSRL